MTVLGRLLAGEGPPVLQTCRFEGSGGQLYGREAIGDHLRALPLGPVWLDRETARLGVWADQDHALVADLIDGHIQRLWLIGPTATLSPPPAVDLPLDPDLAQARPAIRFDPSDHPELAAGDADRLGLALADRAAWGLAAPRPLVLRAASLGPTIAALVRLEGEAPEGPPRPIGFNALILIGPDGPERRLDLAGQAQAVARSWSPRL